MTPNQHRVMVIDDSNTIRTISDSMLSELGHEVMTCTDGFNGVSNMLTFKPDILFIDVEMPRMDGLQTVRLIRANEQFKDTPIVMLSSKDGIFDMALARAAGASDYVVKPPVKESLQAVIIKLLG
ncbi:MULTISPECIES: response regulator [Pseudomonas]|uniref:response regulator n=1 Tax=Pseudomonas TaxID=286 RepID=UPI0018E748CA|nr:MULTISPECIES: response regulator [Pseudomonas]MBJ2213955.1 response regulator [Pseudomonas carnis]MBP5947842.1 response regulator [Pseudomonas sp. P9(2020)]